MKISEYCASTPAICNANSVNITNNLNNFLNKYGLGLYISSNQYNPQNGKLDGVTKNSLL